MSVVLFITFGITFIICFIACVIECNHLNYTPDSGVRYSEEPSQDLVIDLSGVYIQSDYVRYTINPFFNDTFIDLSQNSDSVV